MGNLQPAPAPEPDPLMGIDAQKWAREFMRIWSGRWSEVDESLMIAWFANAIMRGFDEGQRRLREDLQGANPVSAPEPKQGSDEPIDWAKAELWAVGTAQGDSRLPQVQAARAYLALRAEVERLKQLDIRPSTGSDLLWVEGKHRCAATISNNHLWQVEDEAEDLRAELAAARDEIAALKAQLTSTGITPYLDRMAEIAKREEVEKARADRAEERVNKLTKAAQAVVDVRPDLPNTLRGEIEALAAILAARARKEGGSR